MWRANANEKSGSLRESCFCLFVCQRPAMPKILPRMCMSSSLPGRRCQHPTNRKWHVEAGQHAAASMTTIIYAYLWGPLGKCMKVVLLILLLLCGARLRWPMGPKGPMGPMGPQGPKDPMVLPTNPPSDYVRKICSNERPPYCSNYM